MPYRKISAVTSLVVSILVAVSLAALIFVGPGLFGLYLTYRTAAVDTGAYGELMRVFRFTLYPCITIGFCAIYCLIRLLLNVIGDKPFLAVNVTYLRVIAWCCIAVAAICAAASFFFLPFIFAAIASGFVGLMLHVVKNVMHSAAELKEDSDLTI